MEIDLIKGLFIGFVTSLLLHLYFKYEWEKDHSFIHPLQFIEADFLLKYLKIRNTYLALIIYYVMGSLHGLLYSVIADFFNSTVQIAFLIALILSILDWLIMMFILLPLAGRGIMGRLFYKHSPTQTFLLLAIYGFVNYALYVLYSL